MERKETGNNLRIEILDRIVCRRYRLVGHQVSDYFRIFFLFRASEERETNSKMF